MRVTALGWVRTDRATRIETRLKSLSRLLLLDRARTRGGRRYRDGIAARVRHILLHALVCTETRHTTAVDVAVGLAHGRVSGHVSGVAGSKWDLALGVVGRCDLAAGGGAATVVVCGDLGLDATSIRSGANLRQNGPNSLDEAMLLVGRRVLESRLDDVVCKRVAEQSLHFLGGKHLLHDHVLGGCLGTAETLLDDVGAELVTGQLADAASECLHHGLGEGRLVQIDDILNNIVAEGILDEDSRVGGNALNEPELLVTRGMVNAALEDTAAVSVGADLDAMMADGVEDELRISRDELVQTLLNDVVAVEVLDEFDDSEAESLNDEMHLLRRVDVLNHLLECPRAVLVESNAYHLRRGILDEYGSLVVIAELKQLLAQIIAKWVCHELDDMLVGLKPNHMDLFSVALLKLLLKVTAAVLILAQLVQLSTERLQCHVVEAGHCYCVSQ